MAITVAALATGAYLFTYTRMGHRPAGPPEKITIAFSATTDAVLAEVAQMNGYFLEEGLEVNQHLHPYGKPALEDMLAGKADFATVAETPIMFAILNGEKIAVIATIETSSLGNAILSRKDRGILTPADLKGKKIAATLGTTSDFFLDGILVLNKISSKDVEIVDLKAGDMADALMRGDIDAVSTFTPYVALTQQKLGNRVSTFKDKDIYRWTFNVVATQEFIRKNPDTIKKILRALVKAEKFVRENPTEAQKTVSGFSGVEIDIVRDIWADTNFTVTLDQSLILALEDESRWAIKSGLAGNSDVPNYLDFIYFEGLESIKPEAVGILR